MIMQKLLPPGSKVIKKDFLLNSAGKKIFLLINVKMPTIVGILTFISRKNSILSLYEPEKKLDFLIFSYFLVLVYFHLSI